MKLPGFLLFTALAVTSLAETMAPSGAAARLASLPLTIYPRFDVSAGDFAAVFNRVARPDDVLVVSFADARKLSFRVAKVGVTQGQVWVYVDRDVSLGQTYRDNIAGARGLVYVPSRPSGVSSLRYTTEQVADQAKALNLSLAVGLDDRDTRTLSNVADLARSGEVFTLCASSRLHDSVAKTIAAAREANPRIKIELAFIAPMDAAYCDHQLGLAEATADLADRLAIYCETSAESRANLDRMLARLRPLGR
jgi:hypothetical protein